MLTVLVAGLVMLFLVVVGGGAGDDRSWREGTIVSILLFDACCPVYQDI
jgi:hypothetical protein